MLGRDEGFDANADPAVRLEAGRLRRALERYYLVAGQADPVLIGIPKGAYVPVFTARAAPAGDVAPEPDGPAEAPAPPRRRAWAAAAAPVLLAAIAFLLGASGLALLRPATRPGPGEVAASAAPGRPAAGPVLVVTPFADLGEGPEAGLYAAGLGEEVLAQLATSRELTVLGRETSRSIRPGSEATRLRELGAGYALEGGVRVAGGRVRATSRLVEVATGAVLWSAAYDADAEPRSLLAGQEDIARRIATEVAQPFGAVTRAEAGRPPDDPAAYACTLRFHDYQAELGPALHAEVRGCLERAVAAYPRYATAWAMLSVLYLDEDRYRFNPEAGAAPVERAFEAAQRATALDPGNARALQAMMMALFFRQQVAEALRGRRAGGGAEPERHRAAGRVRLAAGHVGRVGARRGADRAGAGPQPGAGRLLPHDAGPGRLHAARHPAGAGRESGRRTWTSCPSSTASRRSSTPRPGCGRRPPRPGSASSS